MRGSAVRNALVLVQRGLAPPPRPLLLVGALRAWRQWGVSLPLTTALGALRNPQRPAISDDRSTVTFAGLHERTTRLAHGLAGLGVRGDSRVGVLCRNHRGPVETVLACAKLGADVVLLNTGLTTEQLHDVLDEHEVSLVVHDSEFTAVDGVRADATGPGTLDELISSSPATPLPPRPPPSRVVVLTSGTTGTPKGARRPAPSNLRPLTAVLSRVPLHHDDRVLVSAPLFHTWGLAGLQLALALGATVVLRSRFEPSETLATLADQRCTALVAVPIMLQRLLDAPGDRNAGALRIVLSSGSALPADLARRFQDTHGPVLYNFYGSTEVSWVSIATPEDLAEDPATAGRPPAGTELRILDENDEPTPAGQVGRIFVHNDMLFEGYTRGGSPERTGNLMSTGDLGRIDRNGRLQVVDREDEVIVSGGENVHPGETERALAAMPDIAETAVIGVPDPEFGQRLAAYVVPRDGSDLDADTVRERLRGTVARFAVPRDVVLLDRLPRTSTGKVVPDELRRRG